MKLMITTLIALLGLTTAVEASEKQIETMIDRVTVYTQHAQIHRKATFDVRSGVHEIMLTGLSPNILANTIQVKGRGEFVILDVQKNTKYPEPTSAVELPSKILKDIRTLEDSILELSFTITQLSSRRSALELEKNMLLNNKLMRGEGKADSIPVFKEAIAFFRSQLNDINLELVKNDRASQASNRINSRMQERLTRLRNYNSNEASKNVKGPDHRIVVTISATNSTPGRLDVSYIVSGAGWSPSYDIRSEGKGKPVTLQYKANVHQNTGIDWDNVPLTLSNSNPVRSITKPNLSTWWIQQYQAYGNRMRKEESQKMAMAGALMDMAYAEDELEMDANKDLYDDLKAATQAFDFATVKKQFANVEFKISLPFSIPSDGKSKLLAVRSEELAADYFHYLVPKLDQESFIIAKVSGWEELDILPGQANIYFDGTFVGNTALSPDQLTDTLDLALGRDPRVTGTWKRDADEVKDKKLNHDRIITRKHEIAVNNRTGSKINLILEDQIPVTRMNEVEIAILEQSGAIIDEKTGKVEWRLEVFNGQELELGLDYTISFDRNLALSGL